MRTSAKRETPPDWSKGTVLVIPMFVNEVKERLKWACATKALTGQKTKVLLPIYVIQKVSLRASCNCRGAYALVGVRNCELSRNCPGYCFPLTLLVYATNWPAEL